MKKPSAALYLVVAGLICLLSGVSTKAESFTVSCSSCPPSIPSSFIVSPGSASGSVTFGTDTFNFALSGGTATFGSVLSYSDSFSSGGGSWSLLDQFNSVLAGGTFLPGAFGGVESVVLENFTADLSGGGAVSLGCALNPDGTDACNFSLTNITVATPEPGTVLLFGVGVL